MVVLKSRRMPANEGSIADGGMANAWHVVQSLLDRSVTVDAYTRATGDPSVASTFCPSERFTVHEVPFMRSASPRVFDRDFDEGRSFVEGIPFSTLQIQSRDVFHVHHWTSAVGLVGRLSTDVRVAYTPHLLAVEKATAILGVPLPARVRDTEAEILDRSDVVLCLSESERRSIFDSYGVSTSKCIIAPNGVTRTSRVVPCTSTDAARTRLLIIGRICRQKGIDVAIEAIEALPSALRQRIILTVVGGSYDEPDYENRVRELAANATVTVRLLGHLSPRHVQREIRESDIYLQPSLYESQGIAIQEALAAGLPVVASAVGAVPSYVSPGVNGLLVSPGDPADLGRAVRELMEDASLVRQLREHAALTPALIDWRASAEAVGTILMRLSAVDR